MEWLRWASRIFVFSSLLFALTKGDYASGAIQAIRCMLSQSVPKDCASLLEITIPSYLVQAYNDSPKSIHETLRSGQLTSLSNAQMVNLPLSLLYLIPRGRWMDLNGTTLGAIIMKHADDTSVARQVVAALHHKRQLIEIMHKLKSTRQDVLRILGEKVNLDDLDEAFFSTLTYLQEPLLAYLRPGVLFKLDLKVYNSVIYHLRGLKNSEHLKRESIRILVQAGLRLQQPLAVYNTEWLVLGLTPDELLKNSIVKDMNLLRSFKLHLSTIQARAVFEYFYQKMSLNQSHVIDCQPIIPKLSPVLLLQFPTRELSYDTLTHLPVPHSLPTACQIREYVMANCKLTRKLPEDGEEWNTRIRYLGHWVYTLPISRLNEYLGQPLGTAQLQQIQSPALSPIQAYYLTGKGNSMDLELPNSVLELSVFLHALPTTQLVSRTENEISNIILQHLVAHLPANNLPRSVGLVKKIVSSLDRWFILENLLRNKDVNTIMSLVSPKDLQAAAPTLLKVLAGKMENNNLQPVLSFPQQVLAVLLDQARQGNSWSWHSLLDDTQASHLLVRGLSCQHIWEMDTGVFIPVMALYNRHRHHAFPKNLQQCCLKKLVSHLQLKMTLSQTDPSLGLISVLEPIDIESIGGYILVGLPLEAMRESPYLGLILSTIGRMSNAELMLAANRSRLQEIAQLVVDEDGNADPFIAGNLIWFLPPNVKIPELKLILETGQLDTTICLPTESRRIIAVHLVSAFGPTESWSAVVLTTLQDLLLVLTEDELRNVSRSAWTEAADCLQFRYGDIVDWIDLTPFYQVCAQVLGPSETGEYNSAVTRLVRLHLLAAQWQLDTVQHLSDTSTSMYPIDENNLEVESKETVRAFDSDAELNSSEIPNDEDESSLEDNSIYEYYGKSTTKGSLMETSSTTEEFSHQKEEGTTSEKVKHNKENKEIITEEVTTTNVIIPSSTATSLATLKPTSEPISSTNQITSPMTTTTSRKMQIVTDKMPQSYTNEPTIEKENYQSTSATFNNKDEKETEIHDGISDSQINKESNAHGSTEMVTEEEPKTLQPIVLHPNKSESASKEINVHSNSENKAKNISTKTPSMIVEPQNKSSSSLNTSSTTIPSAIPLLTNHSSNNSLTAHKRQENSSITSDLNSTAAVTDAYKNMTNSKIHGGFEVKNENEGNNRTEKNNQKIENGEEELDAENDGEGDSIVDKNRTETNTRRKRSHHEPENSIEFSCNALRMVGRTAALALTDADLEAMSEEQLDDCRVELGAMQLTMIQQNKIWKRINKKDGVHLLGNLLKAAKVADLWDLELDIRQPWALETIHAFMKYCNNTLVLKKLLKEIHSSNSEYSAELLMVMGTSACGLEPDNLQSLSVVGLGPWERCPPSSCLDHLTFLALKELGTVETWTQHHVHYLNAIVAGLELEAWKNLTVSSNKPLSGLQPSAVRCLNNSHLEVLSPDQIELIPTLSLLALSQQQLAILRDDQLQALRNATQSTISEKLTPTKSINVAGFPPSGSNQLKATGFVLSFITLFIVLHSDCW